MATQNCSGVNSVRSSTVPACAHTTQTRSVTLACSHAYLCKLHRNTSHTYTATQHAQSPGMSTSASKHRERTAKGKLTALRNPCTGICDCKLDTNFIWNLTELFPTCIARCDALVMHGSGQVVVVYEVMPATWAHHNWDWVVVQEPAGTKNTSVRCGYTV
jgi:hypothetical protein